MTMVTSLVNKVVTSLVNMIMMTYLVNELVLLTCLMSFKVTSLVSILLVTLLQMLGMLVRRSWVSRLVSGRGGSSALGAFSSC